MRKPAFAYAKTKTQISFVVTAKLISAFVFATRIVQSLFYLNFKPLAILCGCTARFVSDLVGNPEDRFSHNEAHLVILPFAFFSHLQRKRSNVYFGDNFGISLLISP